LPIPKRKFTKNGAVLSKFYQNEGFQRIFTAIFANREICKI